MDTWAFQRSYDVAIVIFQREVDEPRVSCRDIALVRPGTNELLTQVADRLSIGVDDENDRACDGSRDSNDIGGRLKRILQRPRVRQRCHDA